MESIGARHRQYLRINIFKIAVVITYLLNDCQCDMRLLYKNIIGFDSNKFYFTMSIHTLIIKQFYLC